MEKIRSENSIDCMNLEVSSGDSIEHINEVLLGHCDEAMQGKADITKAAVKYPVKELINESNTRFVSMNIEYDGDEPIFIVRYFTIDNKEIQTVWHPDYFY
jgi:hypothetical protein